MGQKSNPIVLRLGINKTWLSNWYSEKNYGRVLKLDITIRDYLKRYYSHVGIAAIEIDQADKTLKITMHAARPGIIIGRKGEEAEKLKKKLEHLTGQNLILNIKEVKKPETNAQIVAFNIASQIERRVAFRRVIKRSMQSAMRFNIKGCKIMVSGRLNGAEIARTEWIREGRIPLHTLKIGIEYATYEALTTYGIIGIKVWIYKEDFLSKRRTRKGA